MGISFSIAAALFLLGTLGWIGAYYANIDWSCFEDLGVDPGAMAWSGVAIMAFCLLVIVAVVIELSLL